MAPVGSVTIGLDLGTSGVKVVARDSSGRVVARARRRYPTRRSEPGTAEQDPNEWMTAIDAVMRELGAAVDPAAWAALGLSAMLPTLVTVDERLAPIGPAVTWEDGRAEDAAAVLTATIGARVLYERTGQRLDAHYLLPMSMRRGRPDLRTAGAKDWVYAQLCGELLTDPSTAAGFGAYDLATGAWDPEIMAAAGVRRLPRVAASTTATPLRDDVATRWGCRRGIPVLLGAADSVCGAYGLGALDGDGAVACIAGTSTVVLARSETARTDPAGRYLVTPALDAYGLELDLMTTGSALAWLAALTRTDVAALVEEAVEVPLEDAVLALPYLGPGEQGALWEPDLTGAFTGITLRTTRAELARGILTGVVLELRRCLDVLAEATGRPDAPVMLSGAGGRAEAFRRDLADATGRRVVFDPAEHDHSAVGAARLAACTWAATPAGPRHPSSRRPPIPLSRRSGTGSSNATRRHEAGNTPATPVPFRRTTSRRTTSRRTTP
jgi:xylulokinase